MTSSAQPDGKHAMRSGADDRQVRCVAGTRGRPEHVETAAGEEPHHVRRAAIVQPPVKYL